MNLSSRPGTELLAAQEDGNDSGLSLGAAPQAAQDGRKPRQRERLPIAGFALDGNDWDGIHVGRRKAKDLVYARKVDHGFDKKSAADLRKRLTALIRKTQPQADRP